MFINLIFRDKSTDGVQSCSICLHRVRGCAISWAKPIGLPVIWLVVMETQLPPTLSSHRTKLVKFRRVPWPRDSSSSRADGLTKSLWCGCLLCSCDRGCMTLIPSVTWCQVGTFSPGIKRPGDPCVIARKAEFWAKCHPARMSALGKFLLTWIASQMSWKAI